MKPLELNMHPLDPSFPAGYKLPRDTRITFNKANRMALEKRLTSAELAAEYESARCDALLVQATGHYWQSIECTWSQDTEPVYERERTLLRFATLPHYDEDVTP